MLDLCDVVAIIDTGCFLPEISEFQAGDEASQKIREFWPRRVLCSESNSLGAI